MRRTPTMVTLLALAVAASATWIGCGDDHGNEVTFVGNVISVTPAQAMRVAPSHRWLARVRSFVVPDALAQSSCPAKHVLACASNGRQRPVCARVHAADCRFSVAVDALPEEFANGFLAFEDDANGNGRGDAGRERIAFLLSPPLGNVCNGQVVTLHDVSIDFTTGAASAASVEKDPTTCPPPTPGTPVATRTPTRTPTPAGTPTRTPTPARPTRTPTYNAGAGLAGPPSTMLALLSAIGAVGLLLPSRRRSRE
jgi:hypothetical protein